MSVLKYADIFRNVQFMVQKMYILNILKETNKIYKRIYI